jgi:hypothetical protein
MISSQLSNQLTAGSVSLSSIDHSNTRLRLNDIFLKNLTLIELKYLKQICFNKLKKLFDENENPHLCSNSTSALVVNGKNNETYLNACIVRLAAIPKDESMKTVKTKNIAHHRSKSVDFKFFDELKENYFFKKRDSKDMNEQVFGQSLYKCILNDIKQSSLIRQQQEMHASQNSNTAIKTKTPLTGFNHNSLNLRWKARNKNNLVIASKFDLNLMNNFDILTNNQLKGVQR